MNIPQESVKEMLENVTQGEWSIHRDGKFPNGILRFCVETPDNGYGIGEEVCTNMEKADALLIAAAPSIAKAYLQAMEEAGDDGWKGHAQRAIHLENKRLRDVIAYAVKDGRPVGSEWMLSDECYSSLVDVLKEDV